MNPSDIHDLSVHLQKLSDNLDKSHKNIYEQFVVRMKRAETRRKIFEESNNSSARRLNKEQHVIEEETYWNNLHEELTTMKYTYMEYVEKVEDQLDGFGTDEGNPHMDILESWTETLDHLTEQVQTLQMTTQNYNTVMNNGQEIGDDEFLIRMCHLDKVLLKVIEIFKMMMTVSSEFIENARNYLSIENNYELEL